MHANWFIGLPIAAETWFARLPTPPPGVRLFHPDDLHLTVAFLGAVCEDAARRGFAAARALPLARCEVTLGRVIALGNPRHPSALSALLAKGDEQVSRAIGAIRDAICDAAGAPHDERPPLPHLTLARPRRAASSAQRSAAVRWAAGLDLHEARVSLARVALYTWASDRKERLFTIVEELALSAS